MTNTSDILELPDMLAQTDLERTVLIGFYGGGNYGDELLLEVLGNLLVQRGTKDVTITYQNPQTYQKLHHDFGYRIINMYDKQAVWRAIRHGKNIIIGGGGLWGLNFNFNMLLLSLLLFLSRWVLGKNVYLVGVGYYQSTSWFGHLGAWLAGKAATVVLARDDETRRNFARITQHVRLSRDLAWYIKETRAKDYAADVARLEKYLPIRGKTLLFTLRKLPGYYHMIGKCLRKNQDKPILAGLLVPRRVRPDGFQLLQSWQKRYKNVHAFDLETNPLALFYFFQKHRKQLVLIGPQYHAIITAHLNNVPFLPMVYDNKVAELLRQINDARPSIPVADLRPEHIQAFIDKTYGAG